VSFLTPLYVLGALAVAAPILFHLIRRQPQGRVPFSSLMFLTPSPPRLSRRSRLEHILLLVLRAAALVLLALAFMRPFLRHEYPFDLGPTGPRRVAVLIDTSASMRRGEIWSKAVAQADAALADCKPTDQVALLSFDLVPRTVLAFDEAGKLDATQRLIVARDRLKQLAPTWGGTDLGHALIEALGAVNVATEGGGPVSRKIVLVSDLPQGVRLDALAEFEWPADVELELKTVTDGGGNAGLDLLSDAVTADPKPGDTTQLRVRVLNDAGSKQERFALAWAGSDEPPIDAYVPPGESRVVRVPRPPESARNPALRLSGDTQDFDNTLYVAAPPRDELAVLYLGADAANDPAGLRYYLERALGDAPGRSVRVVAKRPNEELSWDEVRQLPLVVLSGETTPGNANLLQRYVREGGTLVYVIAAPGRTDTLATLADSPVGEVEESRVEKYVMLRDIAFDHPLFAPLAGPLFNDFTKILFWKHRRLDADRLGGARVVARFDDNDPAILEKMFGPGRLVVLTSGWQPDDSQLARSSKFVPIMTALLERRVGHRVEAPSFHVGDRVPLPAERTAAGVTVRKPNGSVVTLAADVRFFDGTDQPGVYTMETPAGPRPFAVNLDPQESLTSPLPAETLEQMGCRLTKRVRDDAKAQHERQMRDVELEGRQALWRWLALGALAVLLVETWLAGRMSRSRPSGAEAV
jgi:hypothetical protein